MCIAFWKLDSSSEYSLVLAFNRDEFFGRPTQGFHIWKTQPNICAPLDMQPANEEERGAWIGVNRQGRLALLTNFRERGFYKSTDKKSRGTLVRDYLLKEPVTPGGGHKLKAGNVMMEYARGVFAERERFGGFNLVLFDLQQMTAVYVTNRGQHADGSHGSMKVLDTGKAMGLSNSTLDDPWPKVSRTVGRFEEVLEKHRVGSYAEQDEELATDLMTMMHDESPFGCTQKPTRIEQLAQCVFVPQVDAGSLAAEGNGH